MAEIGVGVDMCVLLDLNEVLPVLNIDDGAIEIDRDGFASAFPLVILGDGVEEQMISWHVSVHKSGMITDETKQRGQENRTLQTQSKQENRESLDTYAFTPSSDIPWPPFAAFIACSC